MHAEASPDAVAPAGLVYPIEGTPAAGEALELVPGAWWVRLPLPMRLDHVNVWALADATALTIVDTGMQTAQTESAWLSALAGPLGDPRVERVIVTHMHPDHIGMAGWLTRRFDCRLWITRLEYVTCRMLVADTGREAPADALQFYRAAGWSREAIEHYQVRFGGFGKMIYSMPDSYRRVVDGEVIEIGGHAWQAVIGRGHSPEHLCLYCPELKLLISGDQVLPRITSNVSVFPTEPEADPLSEWLESLQQLGRRVPDDVLVLPSHNRPFRGLHARLGQLTRSHEEKLERLAEALRTPRRAVDLFALLFNRPIGQDQLIMATGESLAHLNCLISRGQARREPDAGGVSWYRCC